MAKEKRKCGDCTACCEGWLTGVIRDIPMYPGKPCHFLGCKGCSIYNERPVNPCRDYKCVWLSEETLPEWMKPVDCNVLTTRKTWGPNKEFTYFEVIERGQKIDSTVLNWFFMYYMNTKTPLAIQVDRGWNYYGPDEFLKELTSVQKSD